MSRSVSNLRRALFGVSCHIVFGFGASQALASPAQAALPPVCSVEMEAYCAELCGEAGGYCKPPVWPDTSWCWCY